MKKATRKSQKCLPCKTWRKSYRYVLSLLNPCLMLNPDKPCLCKRCSSRSVGFWRSQLIWLCTVFHPVCEFVATIRIKQSDWLKNRSGRGILIYSAWQGLSLRKFWYWSKTHAMTIQSFKRLKLVKRLLLRNCKTLWFQTAFEAFLDKPCDKSLWAAKIETN